MNREEAGRKNLEGQRLLEAGQYDEAIKHFSEAIEIDANYPAAWLNRSEAKRKLGREVQANADKEKGETLMRAGAEAARQRREAKKGENMKKPTRIVLGIVTLWPIIYMVIFFTFVSSQFFLPSPGLVSRSFPMIFVLHLLTMLAVIGLLIFYIANVSRNDRVANDKKALWAVVLFLGNVIAMPIYWYLYIWREPVKS